MKYSLLVIFTSFVVVLFASAQTNRKSYPGEVDEEPLQVQSIIFAPEKNNIEWLQKRSLSSFEEENKNFIPPPVKSKNTSN